jgi:hypothetical protein
MIDCMPTVSEMTQGVQQLNWDVLVQKDMHSYAAAT